MIKNQLSAAYLLCFLTVSTTSAAWQFNGCEELNSTGHFKLVPLVNRSITGGMVREPIEMDFDMDAQGNVDVYFVQRYGLIRKYDAKSKKTVDLGKISPETGKEDGLTGIELDPNFKTNGLLYLFYSASDGFRLSRFKVEGGKLNNASEVVMLTIPSGRGRWHTGGALEFDRHGNLIISVGDNEALEKGPANTNDLRGKILKIIPKPDGTYDIPKGNLWEFAAAKFEAAGKAEVAKQYRDPTLVRREIYAMGMRNPYAMGLDPKSDWIAYGDCGPDYRGGKSEEHSVVIEPGFYGWPYFTGYDYVQPKLPGGYDEKGEQWWGKKDRNNPENTGPGNTGVRQLLPEIPALNAYDKSCAMSGGFYRYDSTLDNAVKMPPHLDGAWIFADFNQKIIWAAKLNAEGRSIVKKEEMWNASNFGKSYGKMLDLQVGPDGALYVLGYTCNQWRDAKSECSGIYRIEYTGKCLPKKAPVTATLPITQISPSSIFVQNDRIQVTGKGKYRITIINTKGRVFFESVGKNTASYKMPDLKDSGLYFVSISTPSTTSTKAFLKL